MMTGTSPSIMATRQLSNGFCTAVEVAILGFTILLYGFCVFSVHTVMMLKFVKGSFAAGDATVTLMLVFKCFHLVLMGGLQGHLCCRQHELSCVPHWHCKGMLGTIWGALA